MQILDVLPQSISKRGRLLYDAILSRPSCDATHRLALLPSDELDVVQQFVSLYTASSYALEVAICDFKTMSGGEAAPGEFASTLVTLQPSEVAVIAPTGLAPVERRLLH